MSPEEDIRTITYDDPLERRIIRTSGEVVTVQVTGKRVRLETGRGNTEIVGFMLRHQGRDTTLTRPQLDWVWDWEGERVELDNWPELEL